MITNYPSARKEYAKESRFSYLPGEEQLTPFYDDFPPDHVESASAVRHLGGEVGVDPRADRLQENGGHAANGVSARFVCAPKLDAAPILGQSSIKISIEIESFHNSRVGPPP
jgi:hypothetical protein